MPPSKLDAVYRSLLLTKFFTKVRIRIRQLKLSKLISILSIFIACFYYHWFSWIFLNRLWNNYIKRDGANRRIYKGKLFRCLIIEIVHLWLCHDQKFTNSHVLSYDVEPVNYLREIVWKLITVVGYEESISINISMSSSSSDDRENVASLTLINLHFALRYFYISTCLHPNFFFFLDFLNFGNLCQIARLVHNLCPKTIQLKLQARRTLRIARSLKENFWVLSIYTCLD